MTDRKYIARIHDNKWCVVQHIYFGYYDTLEEAIRERDLLIKDGMLVPKVQQRDTRYIRRVKGKYRIQKNINGKMEYFGTFNTLDDARDERDYLESIDWDYSNME